MSKSENIFLFYFIRATRGQVHRCKRTVSRGPTECWLVHFVESRQQYRISIYRTDFFETMRGGYVLYTCCSAFVRLRKNVIGKHWSCDYSSRISRNGAKWVLRNKQFARSSAGWLLIKSCKYKVSVDVCSLADPIQSRCCTFDLCGLTDAHDVYCSVPARKTISRTDRFLADGRGNSVRHFAKSGILRLLELYHNISLVFRGRFKR